MSGYSIGGKAIASKDPFELFNIWFQEANGNPTIAHPNAMNLATASKYIYYIISIIYLHRTLSF